MSKELFTSFKPVSKADWKSKIILDLKGKDYNETLSWKSEEGLIVDPIFHSEDLEELLKKYENLDVSNQLDEGNKWNIVEKIKVNDFKKANKLAIQALSKGAEAIEFDLQSNNLSEEIINILTNDVLVEIAPVNITNFSGNLNLKSFKNINFDNDEITRKLLKSDQFLENDLSKWYELFQDRKLKKIYIDGAAYQNEGAKIAEQLAFILGIGNEYLNQLREQELMELNSLRVKVAIGPNFFFEIAKLRALRKILKVFLAQYNIPNCKLHVHVESSQVNRNKLQTNNNLLRNTSACMSAIIGGVDSVCISAHDSLTEDSEKGRRWARNISHILRNESYFHKVNDPIKGAYYVEALTDQIAEKSWELFKGLEDNGGFLQSWKSSIVQDSLKHDFSTN